MRLLGLVLTVAFVYQVKCQIFDINYTLHNCALKKNAKFSRSSDDNDDDDDGLHLIIMIFFHQAKSRTMDEAISSANENSKFHSCITLDTYIVIYFITCIFNG